MNQIYEKKENKVCKSQFYMLRSLVAMAHADNVLHEKEREYIIDFAVKLPLDEKQLEILMGDLYTPEDPSKLLPKIEDMKFISQLTYFARLMAFKDGVFSPSEEDLLNKMYDYQKEKISDRMREGLSLTSKETFELDNVEVKNQRAFQSKKRINWFELHNILLKNTENDKD